MARELRRGTHTLQAPSPLAGLGSGFLLRLCYEGCVMHVAIITFHEEGRFPGIRVPHLFPPNLVIVASAMVPVGMIFINIMRLQ